MPVTEQSHATDRRRLRGAAAGRSECCKFCMRSKPPTASTVRGSDTSVADAASRSPPRPNGYLQGQRRQHTASIACAATACTTAYAHAPRPHGVHKQGVEPPHESVEGSVRERQCHAPPPERAQRRGMKHGVKARLLVGIPPGECPCGLVGVAARTRQLVARTHRRHVRTANGGGNHTAALCLRLCMHPHHDRRRRHLMSFHTPAARQTHTHTHTHTRACHAPTTIG